MRFHPLAHNIIKGFKENLKELKKVFPKPLRKCQIYENTGINLIKLESLLVDYKSVGYYYAYVVGEGKIFRDKIHNILAKHKGSHFIFAWEKYIKGE